MLGGEHFLHIRIHKKKVASETLDLVARAIEFEAITGLVFAETDEHVLEVDVTKAEADLV